MPWISRLLRGDRVWVRVGPDGRAVAGGDGRVEVLYKPGGKVYRANPRNLEEDPAPEALSDDKAASSSGTERAGKTQTSLATAPALPPADNPYIVYADGACSGNPGPCGIGVVLLDGSGRKEISEYLGIGTNNVAELTAIIRALEVAPRGRTVIVHSDSSYALGLLGKNWKAKANRDLVERMRELAKGFPDLRLVKVAGHAGIPENERADALARAAVDKHK